MLGLSHRAVITRHWFELEVVEPLLPGEPGGAQPPFGPAGAS
jgi:hypothetical protein